ncbi:hypothetical protein MVEG_05653 [Podila verticillata NRRL 6337]|nr:hypothetical protein MVEG_05653 [Podila verticillata NRRL 6337]
MSQQSAKNMRLRQQETPLETPPELINDETDDEDQGELDLPLILDPPLPNIPAIAIDPAIHIQLQGHNVFNPVQPEGGGLP